MAINLKDYGYKPNETAKDSNFVKLSAGGYVCKIFDAFTEEIEGKGLRLTCDIDIDEGEFKGYFAGRRHGTGWDFNARFVRYVLRKGESELTPAFKDFMDKMEKNNPNFKFDSDSFEADDLRALKCGFTFGEKEYLGRDGQIRTVAQIRFPETIDRIRKGLFKIPPIQKLPSPNPSKEAGEVLSDAEREILEGSTPVPDDFPF